MGYTVPLWTIACNYFFWTDEFMCNSTLNTYQIADFLSGEFSQNLRLLIFEGIVFTNYPKRALRSSAYNRN